MLQFFHAVDTSGAHLKPCSQLIIKFLRDTRESFGPITSPEDRRTMKASACIILPQECPRICPAAIKSALCSAFCRWWLKVATEKCWSKPSALHRPLASLCSYPTATNPLDAATNLPNRNMPSQKVLETGVSQGGGWNEEVYHFLCTL